MPTLPTNPHYIGDSGHVNDHNTIVTALSGAVYASGQTGTVDLSGATVKGAGLDFITSATISSASSKSVDNCFTSAYTDYMIRVNLTAVSAASTDLGLRLRKSGSDASANYFGGFVENGNSTSSATGTSVSAATLCALATVSTSYPDIASSSVEVFRPAAGTRPNIIFRSVGHNGSQTLQRSGGVTNSAVDTWDGFTILVASGTISGSIKVYGYRK